MQLITAGVTDCADLAEEMKVSKGTISKWAKRMMDVGRLKKTNRKRYEPNDDPEAS
jgi:Mn-dependent DtxR family transcriptional regulator